MFNNNVYTSNTKAEEENLKINYIYINKLNGLFKNVDCTLALTNRSRLIQEGTVVSGRVFLDFIELCVMYTERLSVSTLVGGLE